MQLDETIEAAVTIGAILLGPTLVLVLSRVSGGARSVQVIWRRALRWIYGVGLAGAVCLLAGVWLEGIEGDEPILFFMSSFITVLFGLSGLVTWAATYLLTRRAN
jgi:predicted outer membrane lipoprotein